MSTQNRTFIDYLAEFRTRMLRSLWLVLIIWLALLPFSNSLFHLLSVPLLKQLPAHSALIATQIGAPFFVPLKFVTVAAFVIAIPFLLYQLWGFIAPALYRREKHWIKWLVLFSSLLFYLGMIFAYFVVFPLLFRFFVQTVPTQVVFLPDITAYLAIALQLLLVFGLAFEVPIAMVVLVAADITTLQQLKQFRRYFIVAAFIIAIFLTPPDVISQTLLAVPLCLLFEVGLLLIRFFKTSTQVSPASVI